MKHRFRTIRSFALISALTFTSLQASMHAQSLEEARDMIRNKDYEAAKLAFSHLIKKYKNRADVNKWYGEALFETGEYNEAKPYLEFAAKRRISGAYPYLAKINLLNYNFEKSIDNYERYLKTLKKNDSTRVVVDSLMQITKDNQNALNSVEQVVFIDSMIVDKDQFFTHYNLGIDAGKLLSNDSPNTSSSLFEESVLFQSQRADKQLLSKKNEGNNLDIVERSKLLGNEWSKSQNLPSPVNTPYDEAFPFMLTDGVTLYYGSNQAGGLGGYDLYITRYNPINNRYFKPEHLSMPFNSPFNDYMMAIDEVNGVGWFATDRYQPKGKVAIYLFMANTGGKQYYPTEDQKLLVDRAKITAISDTWPLDNQIEELKQTVLSQKSTIEKKKSDFFFVINDMITYGNWNEFESKEAKTQFELALKAKNELANKESELEAARKKWANTPKNEREKMRTLILQLESSVTMLETQSKNYEKNARRLEIEYLRKK